MWFVAQRCGDCFSNVSSVRVDIAELFLRIDLCGFPNPGHFVLDHTLCTYTVLFESLWAKVSEVVVRRSRKRRIDVQFPRVLTPRVWLQNTLLFFLVVQDCLACEYCDQHALGAAFQYLQLMLVHLCALQNSVASSGDVVVENRGVSRRDT